VTTQMHDSKTMRREETLMTLDSKHTFEKRIYLDESTYYFAEDVVNPDEYIPAGSFNPHNMRPWLIGNEFGVLGIVYAHHEQDALDEMVDRDKLNSCLLSDEDALERTDEDGNEDFARLGNAGEPFDLDYVWMRELPNKQYAKIKRHFIAMSGSHGCLPDSCEVFPEYQSAVDSLAELFGLGRTRKARLFADRTLELVPGIGEDEFGAEYCEIQECGCDNPGVHSDSGVDLDEYVVIMREVKRCSTTLA
jgi:hypothetical protein